MRFGRERATVEGNVAERERVAGRGDPPAQNGPDGELERKDRELAAFTRSKSTTSRVGLSRSGAESARWDQASFDERAKRHGALSKARQRRLVRGADEGPRRAVHARGLAPTAGGVRPPAPPRPFRGARPRLGLGEEPERRERVLYSLAHAALGAGIGLL